MTDQDHRDHDIRLARQILGERGEARRPSTFVDQFVMLPLVATIVVGLLIYWLS